MGKSLVFFALVALIHFAADGLISQTSVIIITKKTSLIFTKKLNTTLKIVSTKISNIKKNLTLRKYEK